MAVNSRHEGPNYGEDVATHDLRSPTLTSSLASCVTFLCASTFFSALSTFTPGTKLAHWLNARFIGSRIHCLMMVSRLSSR